MNKYGTKWSPEETIVAYYHYCQIPFGKIHKGNQQIIKIAGLLGRTPSSVVLKMANLGHFDPDLQKRNVGGLSNASKTDADVVKMFYGNWEELALRAQELEMQFALGRGLAVESVQRERPPVTDEERRARIEQSFFRETILTSYDHKCCMTGLAIDQLLIASRIKPKAVANPKTERSNPSNGLCLNALHSRAFEQGLLTVLPDYTIRVSSLITDHCDSPEMNWLTQCGHESIALPDKFLPSKELLEYHNDVIFVP